MNTLPQTKSYRVAEVLGLWPQTSSNGITWELVRNAGVQGPPQGFLNLQPRNSGFRAWQSMY